LNFFSSIAFQIDVSLPTGSWISGAESETRYTRAERAHKLDREGRDEKNPPTLTPYLCSSNCSPGERFSLMAALSQGRQKRAKIKCVKLGA